MINKEYIAKTCYEINKALCEGFGDFSQVSWEDAPQWQKDSTLAGVEFNLQNPNALASSSHECWLKEKGLAGWSYGEIKDTDKKEHPCFVPYNDLPKEQQAKDHVFKVVVKSFAPLVL